MGLISPAQAFSDPLFTLAGANPADGGASTGDIFSALLTSALTGSEYGGEGTTSAANLFPGAALAEASDAESTDEDGTTAIAATVLPAFLHLNGMNSGGSAAAHEPEAIDALAQVAEILEGAAVAADLAEGDAEATLSLEFADVESTTAEPALESLDVAHSDAGDPQLAALTAEESAPAATEAAADASPADPEVPALRLLEGLEEPPEAPPDDESADETSVVRSVGNAQETSEANIESALSWDTPALEAAAPDVDTAAADAATSLVEAEAESADLTATATGAEAPAEEPIRMAGNSLESVADAVVERIDADGGEARIILDPPELGEIVIKLHTHGDLVSVEVIAERPEAIQLLRDGSPSLHALLAQRGLDMDTAQFTLNQQGRQSGEGNSDQGQQNDATGFAGLLGFDEPSEAANRNHNKLRAAYNPDGALLYRV